MRLVEKRGATGYMVFFATLEIYAREFKIRDGWKLVISLQSYCRLLALRRADLVQSSLQFIADSGKWEIQINDGLLTVYIPKFLELLDESTQKKLRAKEKKNPETFRNKDADRDKDKEEEYKNPPTPQAEKPPKPARPKGSLSDHQRALFEQFWKSYPKKKSKGQAEKAWSRIKPDAELFAAMMLGLDRAKTCFDWTKDHGQFIPHPATWLNAQGWEDEPEGHQQTLAEYVEARKGMQ